MLLCRCGRLLLLCVQLPLFHCPFHCPAPCTDDHRICGATVMTIGTRVAAASTTPHGSSIFPACEHRVVPGRGPGGGVTLVASLLFVFVYTIITFVAYTHIC